jgi:ubiquinone/menaquinone biosynthesis C-methylase UbiE
MKPLLILTIASALPGQTPQQHHHPPRDAAEYAKHLEASSRDEWQKPHDVVTALALKSTDIVADIGSGSGYFTRRLARHAAKVYAVDIDQKLLERAKESSPPNVEGILAAPDDPKLPRQSVDLVFICDVLHHIDNRPAYLEKLKAALKPGGRIVNIDFHKKPLPVGPRVEMKIAEADVVTEFAAAGLALRKSHTAVLPHQYFLEFVAK